MRIRHAGGQAGARTAQGVAVIIDVLRAFTVSAYALDGGAKQCLLVSTVEQAWELSAQIPGSVISAEVDGLPVAGIEISNSPTQIRQADLRGRTLIQRSSAGTQGTALAIAADRVYAASLVVASATAWAIANSNPTLVTLVAMGDPDGHPEDRACALYLEQLLEGCTPNLVQLLDPLRTSDRYRGLVAGEMPGFPPTDLDLALLADRFDFAMPVSHGRLRREPPRSPDLPSAV
ncbi:MAG TPA: 2-phosphosulfolactate phosphatase [Candidatus Dormibacteraeota bacterium]|jgi:2-phosphosulfolactate phosphatase|nr:2-phosphosulfolactate phosphatase [Candidatus Dormibacteraeota bacterium]